ncbi:uncharacterized protein [Physcomitrium patens]|uniref:Uncharacterized protein n=1 Tax=Physcomitrium patens TaxID=3218 RepID=A0A2K1JLG2_PHYPA|nr:uncharacterized protein LOC112290244 [Physcomitrium patens]PNR42392.1 hypothetical protein PHYPA_017221 [Physcomitrium patens]|eukprot:XP_024392104.1 uncharacterized protein LOC112290244 [Physcomitrella patens]
MGVVVSSEAAWLTLVEFRCPFSCCCGGGTHYSLVAGALRLSDRWVVDSVFEGDALNRILTTTPNPSSSVKMDPGQLVLPVAGIIAAAAVTFYVVSFQQMSEKSFEDYETKIGNDDGSQTQLKSSMSSRKRREAKQASKQKK